MNYDNMTVKEHKRQVAPERLEYVIIGLISVASIFIIILCKNWFLPLLFYMSIGTYALKLLQTIEEEIHEYRGEKRESRLNK